MIIDEKEKQNKIKELKESIQYWHKLIGVIKVKDRKGLCRRCEDEDIQTICTPKDYKYCNDFYIEIEETKEEIERILTELLPHGSGIDLVWNYEFYNNGVIYCKNEFHAINDAGYYVKWIKFKVRIFRHTRNVYTHYKKLVGSNKEETGYQIKQKYNELDFDVRAPNCEYYSYGLRDYLYEIIDNCLYQFTPWLYKIIEKKDFEKPFILE